MTKARTPDNPTTAVAYGATTDSPPTGEGIHDAQNAHVVQLDSSYVERPYEIAMTSDQRDTLVSEGLLEDGDR